MMTNLGFISSNKFEHCKFAVHLKEAEMFKRFNYHYLCKRWDVCLSSKLVSPTCVTLKISINIMDYITNATVLIQKQRPTNRRD